ncbi:hypothetical protein CQ14_06600 [Bradyrhizobium lablabi]|uniref:Uncharacterized protein n=1 Tax=Bradyrhizobium lablabi TaxID=722472 RepID=A0A0R3MMZ9_9BRAD|nr:hypothetical protein [Bradyrhizobium lablabi]KRR21313.1 hypothetical protein CQ14_06600 [Bradyrhizobium lablabi]
MKTISNVAEIVEVLGGIERVAALTEAKDPAVWNWVYAFEAFPANTYFVLIEALKQRGYTAPPHLWKMRGIRLRKRAAARLKRRTGTRLKKRAA